MYLAREKFSRFVVALKVIDKVDIIKYGLQKKIAYEIEIQARLKYL